MNNNVNKQCMEKILQHLSKLICLTEFENIKDLRKLVDMSNDVSAQLMTVDEGYAQEEDEEESE